MGRSWPVVGARIVAAASVVGVGLATPLVTAPATAAPPGATAVFSILPASGNENIWTMHGGGAGLTQLVPDGRDPSISPDGTLVAFNKDGAVWLMNIDGSASHQFGPAGSSLPFAPAASPWSPDSQHLVFGVNRGLVVGTVNGSGMTQLTPTPTNGATDLDASWSPDGSRVAYLEGPGFNTDLWVVNADGSGAHQVTHVFDPTAYPSGGVVSPPAWSPDGSALVIGAELPRTSAEQLETVRPDGTVLMTLPTGFGLGVSGRPWSADGTEILYAAPGSEPVSVDDLWLVNADGTNNRQITRLGYLFPGCGVYQGGAIEGTWLPDGSGISALAGTEGGQPGCPASKLDVVVLHADGSGLTQLTNLPGDTFARPPAWICTGPCQAFPTGQATNTTLAVTSPSTYERETATTMAVTVSAATGTPAGTVTIWTGRTTLCTIRVPGTGSCRIANPAELAAGSYLVVATFVPDDPDSFLPSTSPVQTLVVNPGPTKLVAAPVQIGLLSSQLVTYQATLTSATTGQGLAGDQIDFGPTGPLASQFADARCSAVTNAAGLATCSIPLSSSLGDIIGGHYSASFAGAGNYAPSSTTAAVTLGVL